MASLTLGGQDVRMAAAAVSAGASASGIFLDLLPSGLLMPPDVRGEDTVIPSADGRIERNRVVDRRTVVLEGRVVGTSASDWYGHMQDLLAVLDPTAIVDLVISDSYYGTTGTLTLPVRYMNGNLQTPMLGPKLIFLSLEFESIAPDWT